MTRCVQILCDFPPRGARVATALLVGWDRGSPTRIEGPRLTGAWPEQAGWQEAQQLGHWYKA
jgi:hypothetical protein